MAKRFNLFAFYEMNKLCCIVYITNWSEYVEFTDVMQDDFEGVRILVAEIVFIHRISVAQILLLLPTTK